jgi:hypothetical protein
MAEATSNGDASLDALEVLVGEWSMTTSSTPDPSNSPRARTRFEWLPGKRFLVQRWEVEHPDAPDGIAIIGVDIAGTGFVQHYFDSRGVARVYEMSFADNVWTLERRASASAPDFSQRFTGTFSDDHNTILGRWEISRDGADWQLDFDLTYTRIG